MSIRREQGLLLVAIAIGVLVYTGLQPTVPGRGKVPSPSRDYAPGEVPRAPLTPAPSAASLPNRDPFREPSESSPLPPRPLPFPARAPLPLVALPLPTGPDPGHYGLLHIPGEVAQVSLEPLPPEPAEVPEAPPAEVDPTAQDTARLERIYDQVEGPGGVFYGILEGDKYALAEKRGFFPDDEIVLRRYFASTGRLQQGTTVFMGNEVRDVRLAQNLRNEVETRKRRLNPDAGALADREAFVEWLLERAREESWVYTEAAQQADLMIDLSNGGLDYHRLKVRVFREQGDLEAEWRLYVDLPEALVGTAFHQEGTGQLKARLGLYADAEADLRAAVAQAPSDPLILGSLAYFLLERGRPAEARPLAQRAIRFESRLSAQMRVRVRTALVAADLALGDVEQAKTDIAAIGAVNGSSGATSLRASLAYADGDIAEANTLFRSARTDSRTAVIFRLNPLLGTAACDLRAGRWADARSGLRSVAEQSPLLRHRALSGLGLLYLRIGDYDEALSALDQALVAFPDDPYSLYLRGRCLRELGELEEAVTTLERALRVRDDLLEALAEMAEAHLALADEQPLQEAEHLFRAMRYADRLVELDANRDEFLQFVELQAVVHFRASDLRGARQAFTHAEQLGTSDDERLFSQVGLALVDYAQGRAQIARRSLDDLAQVRPVGDRYRDFAQNTNELIDDHAEKEQIQDRFEREGPELGSIWEPETDRALRPRLREGRMEFRGRFDSKGEVWARRQGALQRGGRFVSLAVDVQEELPPSGPQGFSGVRLQDGGRAGRAPEFTVEFGLRAGQPHLQIEDGRVDDEAAGQPVRDLAVGPLDARQPQRLELRVEESDAAGGALVIRAYWNEQLVHERPLTGLRANTRPEVFVDLVVRGRSGAGELSVGFDNFLLVRRAQ